jgi:hypothetical protein
MAATEPAPVITPGADPAIFFGCAVPVAFIKSVWRFAAADTKRTIWFYPWLMAIMRWDAVN